MRVVVDPWDPSYGSAVDGDALGDAVADVNLGLEVDLAHWAPRRPGAGIHQQLAAVVFVDGVRRVDARVWVVGGDAGSDPGLCASWAAGAVRCDGAGAQVVAVEVGRGLFSASRHAADLHTTVGPFTTRMVSAATPEALSLGLQQQMNRSEVAVAERARADNSELLVVDGPLRGRQHLTAAIGMVKTHHTSYLTGDAAVVLAALAPGERTPVFTIGTTWTRHSWYVRLPGRGGAPLAGVVRCECSADVAPGPIGALADLTAVVLPRFASEAHKDGRAPQNLYPIAGLERELRRRLGDPALVYRALRVAAA